MNIRPRCCPLWLSSLLSLGLAWAVAGAELAVPESVVFERGVEFSNPDNQHLQLNLARPKTGNGPFPSIVCIHGGGFRAGTREGYDSLCVALAEKGYVAVTITYRLSPAYQFPAAVQDSKAAVRWLRANAGKYHLDPTRIGVVAPGTDPAPRAPGSGGPGCAILAIGTLVPRKGHDVLLKALATLPDLDWTLTIAGAPRDAVHADGLRALAEDLGIAQRVTFAGEVQPDALDALWRGADLFALATYWEGYGMAAAEALARGIPVAITTGGAIAEVVPIAAGVIAPPGEVVSLGKAMRRAIFDTDLRAEMAAASWEAGQKLPRWEDRATAFAAELDQTR